MQRPRFLSFFVTMLTLAFLFCFAIRVSAALTPLEQETYDTYLASFEEIYKTMSENYFFPVERKNFEAFIKKFDNEIFGQVEDRTKINDFVLMRSGAFLVDYLKAADDRFSALYPPQVAKEFEQEVLGVRVDLGIEGDVCGQGFCVSFVEPRAEAGEKGLKAGDVLVRIGTTRLKRLTVDEIKKLLTPEIGRVTKLEYIEAQSKAVNSLDVLSKEYFKQTVFPVEVPFPGIFCLEIRQFNRMTSEDFSKYLLVINQQGSSGLILDLRGNPGGPPLAAREIVSFFLTPEKNFAYFERKGDSRNYLDVPRIPEEFRYRGPVVILVNQQSGSASELFSGVMQKEGRAILMGVNTAGQVFLKSMFNLTSKAMLLLVTARGHFPDGNVFDFNGLAPEYRTDSQGVDLINFAAGYLSAKTKKVSAP